MNGACLLHGFAARRPTMPIVTIREAVVQKNERVLLVASAKRTATRAARRIVAAGGEAIIITSVAAARAVAGAFDGGMFANPLHRGHDRFRADRAEGGLIS